MSPQLLEIRLNLAHARINVSAAKDKNADGKALAYVVGALKHLCTEPELMTAERLVEAFEDAAKYTEDNP